MWYAITVPAELPHDSRGRPKTNPWNNSSISGWIASTPAASRFEGADALDFKLAVPLRRLPGATGRKRRLIPARAIGAAVETISTLGPGAAVAVLAELDIARSGEVSLLVHQAGQAIGIAPWPSNSERKGEPTSQPGESRAAGAAVDAAVPGVPPETADEADVGVTTQVSLEAPSPPPDQHVAAEDEWPAILAEVVD